MHYFQKHSEEVLEDVTGYSSKERSVRELSLNYSMEYNAKLSNSTTLAISIDEVIRGAHKIMDFLNGK